MKYTSKIRSANESGLAVYMRDATRHALLSRPDEQELGERLVRDRVDYWHRILSHPPFTKLALRSVLKVEGARAAAERLRVATEAILDANDRRTEHDFRATSLETASCLAQHDSGCAAADRFVSELHRIDADRFRSGSEREAFVRYVERVDAGARALRDTINRIARANLRLVVHLASRFYRTELTLQDRIQEGNIGLIKAIERFDPSRGCRLSTYATWWIENGVRRAVVAHRRTVRVPEHVHATARRIRRARAELRRRLQREPAATELAEAAGVSRAKLRACNRAMGQRVVSLGSPISGDGQQKLEDALPDDALSQDERMIVDDELSHLRRSLLHLTPIARDILRRRFGLDGGAPQTLQAIGERYALSRERIRQLQIQALGQLRSELSC